MNALGGRDRRTSNFVIALWIFALAARLVLINQPFVDQWSWRQTDVAAIARNFSEKDFHFAYPQIDWAGDAPGYVGTEFPILPFIAALCYKLAGVHEWIGRSQAVIVFAVSLPFFFLLVCEIFGNTAAIWATFFYSFAPLNIFAGRSFIPDVPSLSLALIGLYLFLRWIDNEQRASFVWSAFAISLALLIKLPTVLIGAPFAYLAVAALYERRINSSGGHRLPLQLLVLFAAITLLPTAIWYWHAYRTAESFYPHHFFGEGGIRIESFAWYWNIVRVTATSSLTPVLAVMAVIGLCAAPRRKYARLFHWWLAAMILFIVVVGYGNRHPWYQLPLVPIAAAFAGAAYAFIESKISPSRIAVVGLSILVASSFLVLAYLYVRPLYRSSAAAELRDAGLELKKTTAPDSLIIAADTGDPTVFYYAERRGWHFLENHGVYNGNPSDSRQLIVDLEEQRSRGATHLVFIASTFWWLEYYPEFTQYLAKRATLLKTTPEFKIYRLTPAAK
jgi:4-amino-4-deoxy-L-arabinose transferase-like glycosyltransferase